jgi:uncharacterized repeat protein (TIGR03803 family)
MSGKCRFSLSLSPEFILRAGLVLLLGAWVDIAFGNIAVAQTESVFYTFCEQPQCTDGALPNALIGDAEGNFYGTTEYGGVHGWGVVFGLAPSGNESVLFSSFGTASGPQGVILDAEGNLYGESCCVDDFAVGAVFKLKKFRRKYGFEFLYHFNLNDPANGYNPSGNLALDSQGNLYGTTPYGGGPCQTYSACGTVFQIAPDRTETVVYSFMGGADGIFPSSGVILDGQGNMYGTTDFGGIGACNSGCGIVFKLTPQGDETILYTFLGGTDGEDPGAGLVMDASGNLYGTTVMGGIGTDCEPSGGCGIAFKIAPDGTETVLHTFLGGNDGANPVGPLIFDSQGNLYGTTTSGGGSNQCYLGCGTVFQIAPNGNETILYSFSDIAEGVGPIGNLVFDAEGNLYGIASGGESQNCPYNGGACGVVFKIAP